MKTWNEIVAALTADGYEVVDEAAVLYPNPDNPRLEWGIVKEMKKVSLGLTFALVARRGIRPDGTPTSKWKALQVTLDDPGMRAAFTAWFNAIDS